MRKDLAARLQSTVGSLIPHHEDNIKRVIDGLDAPAEKPGTPVPRIERPVVRTTADAAEGAASESPASAEELALADKLMRQSGNWFVIKLADGSAEQSVKLLWVNPHTRNMLFVDQHGAKVALMPATTLARKIREGEIRPKQQESSSFVARSLRRIRRALEDSVNT